MSHTFRRSSRSRIRSDYNKTFDIDPAKSFGIAASELDFQSDQSFGEFS